MKIRTIKYIIKEGSVNAYRNKLMSLASIAIMTATLVISGLFFLLSANLTLNANELKNQAQIRVFCELELDDTQVAGVEAALKKVPEVTEAKKLSKKDNFEKMKALFPDSKDILDGLDESFLSVSFELKLKNMENSSKTAEEFKKIQGVRKVQVSEDVISFYRSLSTWVRIFTVVILIILLTFSVFIIFNTVKLTVYARRREVNIMKYIGATDWFIRWPFIVEGIIIGILGALVSFGLVMWGYQVFINWVGSNGLGTDIIKVVRTKEIWKDVIAVFVVLGVSVGSISSGLSLKKHLQV